MPVCVLPHPLEPLTELGSVHFFSKISHSLGVIILMG
jgi:hypothetical protein